MCFTELLKKEMLPAMGCTEPAASALAGAKAKEILGNKQIKSVEVYASRDMVKNAMGVGIPNCNLRGINVAVALGICGGKTEDKLSILSSVTESQVKEASKLSVSLSLVKDVPALYVSVKIFADDKSWALATVSGEHDRFSQIEKDGKVLVSLPLDSQVQKNDNSEELKKISVQDIIDYADNVGDSDLDFIDNAIKTNMKISLKSIQEGFGLQVGKTTAEGNMKPETLSQAMDLGASFAAAGSDARMSGCNLPVVINSGSGNQGITVTVPVKIVGDFLKCSDEKILRAVCVSELVGLALTARKNRLSALCGAFTASVGTACAYCYLLDGGAKMMDLVLNTMVGDMTGIVCDGAKSTCALKIYSSLQAAAMSVKLAIKGFAPGAESGIVGKNSFDTLNYLSKVTLGMTETDKAILSVMLDKKC